MTKLNKQSKKEKNMISMKSVFAKETNMRDEDAEREKFIKIELEKRLGPSRYNYEKEKIKLPSDSNDLGSEYVISKLPSSLIETNSRVHGKSEETLSHQMLSGIPEVSLGIQEKIRNIEETEDAKRDIIHRIVQSNSDVSVNKAIPGIDPDNIQHNRYNLALVGLSEYQVNRTQVAGTGINTAERKNDEYPKTVSKSNRKRSNNEVVVNNSVKHSLLEQGQEKDEISQKQRPGPNVASDDFALDNFRKKIRFDHKTRKTNIRVG
ncbi:hypothetical protein SNEBB_010381 [Seison nebaliae]|nr:hypothetical protein SNEBB_010381 [Seison nebaliae]